MDPRIPTEDAAAGPSNDSAGARQQPAGKPLSCTNCRARKLKCSREHPCHHCVRSGGECIFPVRKRIRRPRRSKNAELLQRLSRLESIVGRVGLGVDGGGLSTASTTAATAPIPGAPPGFCPPPFLGGGSNDNQPLQYHTVSESDGGYYEAQEKWDEAAQDTKASKYLSGQFWTSLGLEVEGLRQALESSTDSDEEEQPPLQGATPDSIAYDRSNSSAPSAAAVAAGFPSGLLLGSASHFAAPEQIEHPSPDHIRFLTATFCRNVDMILKILHWPTIEAALLAFADASSLYSTDSPQAQLSPEKEALFFAIYHAATVSLSTETCLEYLGRHRDDLVRTYAAGTEHLLVRADYLNSSSLETLQALTLYIACLRSHNRSAGERSGSRPAWVLVSLVVRLAQALSLHREAANTRLSPYEAELRRRLWWQIIVLDIRASEDRGTTTVIARDSYDTRIPLNINDTDFGPDTPRDMILVERQGHTDVTFNLCTAHCSRIFLHVEHAQCTAASPSTTNGDATGSDAATLQQPQQGVEQTIRHAQELESQFVTSADTRHPGSYLASIIARVVIFKLWLIMQYPVHPRQRQRPGPAASSPLSPTSTATPQDPRTRTQAPALPFFPHEATLRTAISIIELDGHLHRGPYSDRFRWWADTYVQWHPLAVALAELCTPFHFHAGGDAAGEDLVAHAWRVVDDVFPRWSNTIADAKGGTLWRPIRKLYKKARAARAEDRDHAVAATPTLFSPTRRRGPSASALTGFEIDGRAHEMLADAAACSPAPLSGAAEPPYSALSWRDFDFGLASFDDNDEGRGGGGGADNDGVANTYPYSSIMMRAAAGPPAMDWSTWDDFVDETQAADGQSRSGSSRDQSV
ncbi:fungal-specific transcription factor domain-containing protein [Durotheca rogersii]|uniref:fungal-specific transcription factor domain-containing protein n=1 Tax=Durotheca rogersii TaxID=419775 RepID=UPI002220F8DE|nr:fungal-specific transcription factor domain-containing protein [Durotheca rogersii]KAI5864931.1 fungal-specific transcription factor domain-containing protein [Durotheca rogersii]